MNNFLGFETSLRDKERVGISISSQKIKLIQVKSIPLKVRSIIILNRCPNHSLKHKFHGGEWTKYPWTAHHCLTTNFCCLFSDDYEYSQAVPGLPGHHLCNARHRLPLSPQRPPVHFEPLDCAMVETRAFESPPNHSLVGHGFTFAPEWLGEFAAHLWQPDFPTLPKTPFTSPPPLALSAPPAPRTATQCPKAINAYLKTQTTRYND